jgi:hypothetical protein
LVVSFWSHQSVCLFEVSLEAVVPRGMLYCTQDLIPCGGQGGLSVTAEQHPVVSVVSVRFGLVLVLVFLEGVFGKVILGVLKEEGRSGKGFEGVGYGYWNYLRIGGGYNE